MTFTQALLPSGKTMLIPSDIYVKTLTPEQAPHVSPEYLHSLTYIPWNETYLSLVPQTYREFYRAILPRLGARSTDVHTALSVSFVDELISLFEKPVDQKILTIAVLLHDIGWSHVPSAQVALSLNYSAFTYTEEALRPKRLHASLGAAVAQTVLHAYRHNFDLTDHEISFITDLVRFHDHINPWPESPEPAEYLLLGDADRLWSYTHENFWLDTIRKNIEPSQYVENIAAAIDDYFLTDCGRTIARRLVTERRREVVEMEAFGPASIQRGVAVQSGI